MLTTNIFIQLGSNMGDRAAVLRRAMIEVEQQIGRLIKKSAIYETAAWGKTNQPNFLNQLVRLESLLTPDELLSTILSIETDMGRVRHEKWGARTIDIDIIYFNDKIIQSRSLTVPHPEIAHRKFVLVPLNEISPDFIHPLLQKSNAQLLNECVDTLPVNIFIN